MASKLTSSSLALLLVLNLLFFALVSSQRYDGFYDDPTPSLTRASSCPIDALQLGVCANVLGGLLNIIIGTPPKDKCCSLIGGLVDLEAAACLCTTVKVYLPFIKLDVPVALSLLLNDCGKGIPNGLQCSV